MNKAELKYCVLRAELLRGTEQLNLANKELMKTEEFLAFKALCYECGRIELLDEIVCPAKKDYPEYQLALINEEQYN